jgi:hypothetical protein
MIIKLLKEMEISGVRYKIGDEVDVTQEVAEYHNQSILADRKILTEQITAIKKKVGKK